MAAFKGRAIIYPGLLIAGWIIGRSISLSAAPSPSTGDAPIRLSMDEANKAIAPTSVACPSPFPVWEPSQRVVQIGPMAQAPHTARGRTWPLAPAPAGPRADTAFPHPTENFNLFELGRTVATPDFASNSFAVGNETAGPVPVDTKIKRLQLYGYGFWRQGTAPASLAPNAQYGGSQFGMIATWDPFGSAGKGPALLLRGSGTPDGQQREVALGTRWLPSRQVPLSLSMERRFRANSPDSFVGYVAGGVDRIPLVGRLALDAYGQAGYSLGGQSSPFVDAQARLQYPVAKPLGIPIRIGAGAWVGGQKGAFRGDIGPTVSADIDARLTKFTLQLDWRKRAVGNAAPDDGLALTVSTGF